MRQFEANHLCCCLDGSLTSSFVLGVYLVVISCRLEIGSVSLTEKEHFILHLAQLLIGRLIFSELCQDVL